MTKDDLTQAAVNVIREVRALVKGTAFEATLGLEMQIVWLDSMRTTAARVQFWLIGTEHKVQIELSWPVFSVERNQGYLRQSVLHELAHVMCWSAVHDELWEQACRLIGGDPKAYHELEVPRYTRPRNADPRVDMIERMRLRLEQLEAEIRNDEPRCPRGTRNVALSIPGQRIAYSDRIVVCS